MLPRFRRRPWSRTSAPRRSGDETPGPPDWPEHAFEDRMATVEFRVAEQPHIVVDTEACRSCAGRPCIGVCPADLFTPTADGGMVFNHEQCFECGACTLVCSQEGTISWSYPPGGQGVVLRWA
ncbi:ferredoxin family protein [Marinactinospora thermotolerans]|nr:4Fe-4S dicluster domain-containing protein [Marinactinospora thermotolerans]